MTLTECQSVQRGLGRPDGGGGGGGGGRGGGGCFVSLLAVFTTLVTSCHYDFLKSHFNFFLVVFFLLFYSFPLFILLLIFIPTFYFYALVF